MKRHGLDWGAKRDGFLDLLLGEGMHSVWRDDSQVRFHGKEVNLARKPRGWDEFSQKDIPSSMFYIPAQRVLTWRDGWPRSFTDYSVGDPFAVRDFSERMRLLMEKEFVKGDVLFPQSNRLKSSYRELMAANLFGGFQLKVDRSRPQKRLVLHHPEGNDLPFMVWSAGQREFMPLLLGLYWLMPPGSMPKRDACQWVVIEELEMGLHPRAINLLLLMVLELLSRGYKVCLSTHSPQVLELVWALNLLRAEQADPKLLAKLFDVSLSTSIKTVFTEALSKNAHVYWFDRDGGHVRDISSLDPGSTDSFIAGWGGLADFSERANEVVARAVAEKTARYGV